MIDLKELAGEYSVKINEKGSKAVAVDKILQKIDELECEIQKELEELKTLLSQAN